MQESLEDRRRRYIRETEEFLTVRLPRADLVLGQRDNSTASIHGNDAPAHPSSAFPLLGVISVCAFVPPILIWLLA